MQETYGNIDPQNANTHATEEIIEIKDSFDVYLKKLIYYNPEVMDTKNLSSGH